MTTNLKEFEPVFTRLIVPTLIQYVNEYKLPQNALEWFQKACGPSLLISVPGPGLKTALCGFSLEFPANYAANWIYRTCFTTLSVGNVTVE